MDERNERDLKGKPSDYGSRTLADTADGEPLVERGTVDSARTDDDEGEGAEEQRDRDDR